MTADFPTIMTDDVNLPILILATGQSNELGHAGTTTGERRMINGNVYLWEQFPEAGQTTGWKRAGPASTDWPFMTTGNAKFYHFADMVQRMTGRVVLVVQQSVGGTPIAEWMPNGGGVSGATGFMWQSINASLVAARAAEIPGRTDGATLTSLNWAEADIMIWHQGEADADYRFATDARSASKAQYLQRHRSIIAAMRDPAASGSTAPKMIKAACPVIVGELLIGGTSGGNATDDRNDALRQMGAEDELVACAKSAGLRTTDNLHFDGADLVEYARRYFHALGSFPKASWVVRGTAGGTAWEQFSDGRLVMENFAIASVATTTASGSGFTSGSAAVWTFPTTAPTFIASPAVLPQHAGATARWVNVTVRSATSTSLVAHSWVSSSTAIPLGARAEGRWR